MDLLIVNHRDPKHPKAGGAEEVLYQVGRRLVKKGVKVTWLSEGVKGLEGEEEIEGIRIKRRGSPLTLHLYSIKEAMNHEIVVDSIAHAVPFYSFLVNEKAIALVHHVHQEVVYYELSKFKAWTVSTLERDIRKYDRVIAVSNTTKRDLSEKLGVDPEKVTTILNGLDHQKFRPGKKSEEPTLLWIGRMKKYKNPLDAVEVAKRTGMKLVVAGGGELEREVKRKVEEIGGVFLGKVSEEEKVKLYQSAWITLVTSFIEGWSMVTVESNACGTPVIAYKRGSLPEVVKEGVNGYLVEYKDVEGMAKRVKEVVESGEVRELWRSSYEESLNYDWDKTSDAYYSYLRKVYEE